MTDTLVERLQEALKQWWSFDDRQRHTHSWHTRTDFIYTELPKLVAPFDAEIERLREAAKGSTIIVNQASATIKQQEAEIERLTRVVEKLSEELEIREQEGCMDDDACREMENRALAAESSLSEAVKAEREACAKICDQWLESSWGDEVFAAKSLASAIRARAVVDSERGSTQKEVSE